MSRRNDLHSISHSEFSLCIHPVSLLYFISLCLFPLWTLKTLLDSLTVLLSETNLETSELLWLNHSTARQRHSWVDHFQLSNKYWKSFTKLFFNLSIWYKWIFTFCHSLSCDLSKCDSVNRIYHHTLTIKVVIVESSRSVSHCSRYSCQLFNIRPSCSYSIIFSSMGWFSFIIQSV